MAYSRRPVAPSVSRGGPRISGGRSAGRRTPAGVGCRACRVRWWPWRWSRFEVRGEACGESADQASATRVRRVTSFIRFLFPATTSSFLSPPYTPLFVTHNRYAGRHITTQGRRGQPRCTFPVCTRLCDGLRGRTQTSIMAVQFKDGVVIGADSRTTTGSYIVCSYPPLTP